MHEYVTISSSSYDPAALASKLTEKSAEGWDVVSIVQTGGDVTAFLRRGSANASSNDSGSSAGYVAAAAVAAPAAVAAVAAVESTPEAVAEVVEASAVEEAVVEEAVVEETVVETVVDEVPAADPTPVETPVVSEPSSWIATPSPEPVADVVSEPSSWIATPDPEPVAVVEEVAAISEPAGWAVTPDAEPAAVVEEIVAVEEVVEATPVVIVPAEPEVTAVTESMVGGSTGSLATEQVAQVSAVPAGWYADPSGRFELRYWDGNQWTEHVARGGAQYTDPPVA
jgi:Protein of unknown function (DUF2510)